MIYEYLERFFPLILYLFTSLPPSLSLFSFVIRLITRASPDFDSDLIVRQACKLLTAITTNISLHLHYAIDSRVIHVNEI